VETYYSQVGSRREAFYSTSEVSSIPWPHKAYHHQLVYPYINRSGDSSGWFVIAELSPALSIQLYSGLHGTIAALQLLYSIHMGSRFRLES